MGNDLTSVTLPLRTNPVSSSLADSTKSVPPKNAPVTPDKASPLTLIISPGNGAVLSTSCISGFGTKNCGHEDSVSCAVYAECALIGPH